MPPSLTLILCKVIMSIYFTREHVSLQSDVVIILVIGALKLHSFLKGTYRTRGLSKDLTDTYHALRRHLPRDVAPGFDDLPLSCSAIREDNENQTRRPLLKTNLVDFGIYLHQCLIQGLGNVHKPAHTSVKKHVLSLLHQQQMQLGRHIFQ